MGGKSNMIELIKQEPRDDGRDMIIPFSVTLKDGCLKPRRNTSAAFRSSRFRRRRAALLPTR